MPTRSFRKPASDEKFKKSLKPHHKVVSENGRRVTVFCRVHGKKENLSRSVYYCRKNGLLCCFYAKKSQPPQSRSGAFYAKKSQPPQSCSDAFKKPSKEKSSNAYIYWRLCVLALFNQTCFISGAKGTVEDPLNCHHLNSWRHFESQRYDVLNGVVLKASLHRNFHSWLGGTHKVASRELFETWANQRYGFTSFPWYSDHEPEKIQQVLDKVNLEYTTRQARYESLAKQRNHKLRTSKFNFKVLVLTCLTHDVTREVKTQNYVQARFGMPCCVREKLSDCASRQMKQLQEKNARKLDRVLKRRNHVVLSGTLNSRHDKIKIHCLIHDEINTTTVHAYKQSSYGMPCCVRTWRSRFMTHHNRQPEKLNKQSQKFLLLCKQRNHLLMCGETSLNQNQVQVKCLLHGEIKQMSVFNYKQSQTGMPCCALEKMRQNVRDPKRQLLAQQTRVEKTKNQVFALLKERNHTLVSGTITNGQSKLTLKCLLHDHVSQTTVCAYKHKRTGMPCCAREKMRQSAFKTNGLLKQRRNEQT